MKANKSAKKTALIQADHHFVWHPFTQMQDWIRHDPVIITRGKGNYIFDVDGKKYLDAISSLWVTVHGHCHPQINTAIKKQVDRISHSTLLGLANEPSITLAKELVKIAPQGLKKVFYSDSGSTAVEIALKIAYQFYRQTQPQSKRDRFITFTNAYHGDTLGSVSVGGIDLFHEVYKPLLMKNIIANFENFETVIAQHAKNAAAVIIEPLVQGAAGMLLQPKGFLKRLQNICRKHDVLLICDEVATGFGRTGKMFACEHDHITPDLLCIAKGLSGGYLPLAATLTTDRIYKGFCAPYAELKTFFHGHTFTGNPLACAAALANLAVFRKNQTIKKLKPKINHMYGELKKLSLHPNVKEIRQCGMMVGIELCASKKPLKSFDFSERRGAQVCAKAREFGMMLRPLGDVIVYMPPLTISNREISQLVSATRKAIDSVCSNAD